MSAAALERAFATQLTELLARCRFAGPQPPRLIVGFSGGADSTALLLLCYRVFPQLPLQAAHLNHSLRGAESDADEAFCRDFCASRRIQLHCRKLDVGALAQAGRRNLEDAAREARRAFFSDRAAEVCAAHGEVAVLLAQHEDDQVETVLLRLLRGSGWRGLRGIGAFDRLPLPASDATPAPGAGVPLLRPLLPFSHCRLTDYLTERGVGWREDGSNADCALARNRLRHAVLPALVAADPDCRQRLLHAARLAAEVEQHLAQETRKVLSRARAECGGFFLPFPQPDESQAAPEDTAQTVWLRAAERLAESLPGGGRLREENFSALRKILHGRLRAADLCCGVQARRERDGLFAAREDDSPRDGIFLSSRSAPPPVFSLWFANPTFEYAGAHGTFTTRPCSLDGVIPEQDNPYVEYLDPARLRPPLELRFPAPQERVLWFGEKSARTISGLMKSLAVPPRWRTRLLLLADRNGPLWLPPLRLAARAGCTGTSGPALRVEFRPPVFPANII